MNPALESINPANIRMSECPQTECPATEESPYITYDRMGRLLVIEGNSSLENAETFYKPFVDQLYDDLHVKRSASVDFHLTVLGHKTTKVLFKLFENLKYFKLKNRLAKIIWRYDQGDSSMRELGEAFSELFELDFDLKETIR